MLRSILAVFLGLVACSVTVGLVEALGMLVYPVPAGINIQEPAAMRAYVESRPFGALLFVLGAWLLASALGPLVASLVHRSKAAKLAPVVGGIFTAIIGLNLISLPHPWWMFTLGLAAPLPIAYWVGWGMQQSVRA